jgi:hypothetical protein
MILDSRLRGNDVIGSDFDVALTNGKFPVWYAANIHRNTVIRIRRKRGIY